MTWYPDLSQYSYLPEFIPTGQVILNVGWLESGHNFPVGDPPGGFLDALAELCAGNLQAPTRGWHECDLCDDEDLESPCTVDIGGNQVKLGSAEVRVISEDGKILSAPNLVLHYVDRHRYLPPAEFVEAVLARREVSLRANRLSTLPSSSATGHLGNHASRLRRTFREPVQLPDPPEASLKPQVDR
jgi:hypothetical protein